MRALIAGLLGCLLFTPATVFGDENPQLAGLDIDITRLSIEELLNVKITSVSKRPEQITHAPAAVYVLTSEDIRHSGVTSVPEVLRLVPGVHVARIDANKWAVSIRGFNGQTANKLLVLIDGRSIYDPLFSGVLWETKDVMLENIERIEVVRGPGGTLWGANAVNGVINIITKNARQTQGGLVAAGAGTEERFINWRYGYELAENHYIRVYGKGFEKDPGFVEGGADDRSSMGQAGFRYDGTLTNSDTLMIRGDFYDGSFGYPDEAARGEREGKGGNLLGLWARPLDNGGGMSAQMAYSHTELDDPVLGEVRDTYDFEFQHDLPRIGDHEIIWGVTYRRTHDDIRSSSLLGLTPDHRTDSVTGLFVQDDIALSRSVYLTVGSKFESNDYTGSEVQPNIRLAWRINSTDTFWAAVSRAVRTPSRLESDFVIQMPDGSTFAGGGNMDSEELVAYETGVRFNLTKELYMGVTAFYNEYDRLFTVEGSTLGNRAGGNTSGVEVAAVYVPAASWKISVGYSYLNMNLKLDRDSLDDPSTRIAGTEGQNPEHQAFVRLGTRLFKHYELDVAVRYVDELPALNVPSYTVADLRLARRINDNLELSIVGQNLFEDRHFEWGGNQVTQVEDSMHIKILYNF
ncbi:MAG TPA: TonB-dependent receptor [Gammaproteobacteria bacterium]